MRNVNERGKMNEIAKPKGSKGTFAHGEARRSLGEDGWCGEVAIPLQKKTRLKI